MYARSELQRPDAVLVAERTGDVPDTLLLHAGGEQRAVWRPVMAALADRGLQSIAYDQRGHGESSGAPGDGVLAYAADAKVMIENLARPVVVGGSLGGFALMGALADVEAIVAGLVLVDVTPAPDHDRTRTYLAPRDGLGTSPLVADILAKGALFEGIVARLRLPILLICAGQRSPLGEGGRARFRVLAPAALIEIIPEAGHLIARDAPLALAQMIADFALSDAVQARH